MQLYTKAPSEKDLQIMKEKVMDLYNQTAKSEYRVYSQNLEDGVIQFLINLLNIKNGLYVEFGTESGEQCNTRLLREKYNWTGLLMDGTYENATLNQKKEMIHSSNIVQLFQKYKVQKEMDILSVDTDYGDYWIMEEVLLANYRPKIVIHEVNQQPPNMCVATQKTKEIIFWNGSEYNGGSVCAFHCQAKRFGFTMVYCESRGVNCFWIRDDLLENVLKVKSSFVKSILTPQVLKKQTSFVYYKTDNVWHQVVC